VEDRQIKLLYLIYPAAAVADGMEQVRREPVAATSSLGAIRRCLLGGLRPQVQVLHPSLLTVPAFTAVVVVEVVALTRLILELVRNHFMVAVEEVPQESRMEPHQGGLRYLVGLGVPGGGLVQRLLDHNQVEVGAAQSTTTHPALVALVCAVSGE
jgi:hypothetical protein